MTEETRATMTDRLQRNIVARPIGEQSVLTVIGAGSGNPIFILHGARANEHLRFGTDSLFSSPARFSPRSPLRANYGGIVFFYGSVLVSSAGSGRSLRSGRYTAVVANF